MRARRVGVADLYNACSDWSTVDRQRMSAYFSASCLRQMSHTFFLCRREIYIVVDVFVMSATFVASVNRRFYAFYFDDKICIVRVRKMAYVKTRLLRKMHREVVTVQMNGCEKEPNKFHNYEAEKITQKSVTRQNILSSCFVIMGRQLTPDSAFRE